MEASAEVASRARPAGAAATAVSPPPSPTPASATAPATAPAAAAAPPSAAACEGPLTVLYDGSCPLCRREIGLYQTLAERTPGARLAFQDVSLAAGGAGGADVTDVAEVAEGDCVAVASETLRPAPRRLPEGTTQAQLMARFHVQRADGSLDSGARAFVALWARLPGWQRLAWVARLPGVTPLLELAYRGFLPLRPLLQRAARAFEPPALHVPAALLGDLRSDHAGETGAVWIYRGVLALARDPALRAFAARHQATEQEHLRLVAACLPWLRRSRLLPAWRLAGFMTGALPALAGPRAVYATIAAVETFVDRHYQQQLDRIDGLPDRERSAAGPLRALLQRCQADEQHHRDEAAGLQAPAPGALLRAWCALVGQGSAVAVALARRL